MAESSDIITHVKTVSTAPSLYPMVSMSSTFTAKPVKYMIKESTAVIKNG